MENPLYTRSRVIVRELEDFRVGERIVKAHQLRGKLRSHYSYAVPDELVIERLVEESPIVEIGAGLGYWGWLVDQKGGEIICFDYKGPGENDYVEMREEYYPVHQGSYEVLDDHSDRTLFICWPNDFNQKSGWSDETLETYLSNGGHTLALVSEGNGGAAGSDRLFEIIESEMKRVDCITLPTFPALHDKLEIFKTKN